jgi:hypothetical protein
MTSKNIIRIAVASAITMISVAADAGNPDKTKSQSSVAKTATDDAYQPMLIGNVFNY